jgi:hypothetical protein
VIDHEDFETLRSLDQLHRLFNNELDTEEIEKLAVTIYDKDDPDWRDRIVIKDEKFFLEGFSQGWENAQEAIAAI